MNTTVSVVVQHLLFLFLVTVAPIWDYVDTRRLKQHPDSARKIRYYRTLCIWLWAATVVACLAVGFRPLFTISPKGEEASWFFEHSWVRWLVEVVIAIFMALTLLPVCIVIWKKIRKIPRKWSSADALKSLSFFLPATWAERRWYAVVAITAGICEEVLSFAASCCIICTVFRSHSALWSRCCWLQRYSDCSISIRGWRARPQL